MVYSHVHHLVALSTQLRQIGGLLAVVVHVDAETRGVAHSLLADLTLQSPFSRVVFVSYVYFQVVTIREKSVTRRTLNPAGFAVPSFTWNNIHSHQNNYIFNQKTRFKSWHSHSRIVQCKGSWTYRILWPNQAKPGYGAYRCQSRSLIHCKFANTKTK